MRIQLMAMSVFVAVASLAPGAATQARESRQDSRDSIDCTSQGFARQRCDVSWHDARLAQQLSDTTCVRDQNWGIDNTGLWVDRGCAGRFVAASNDQRNDYDRSGDHGRSERDDDHGHDRGDRRDAWQPAADWNHRFSVTCESQDASDQFCAVDLGRHGRASLQRQLSSTRCRQGKNWGFNRAGVWVSQGCRGEFAIDRRW